MMPMKDQVHCRPSANFRVAKRQDWSTPPSAMTVPRRLDLEMGEDAIRVCKLENNGALTRPFSWPSRNQYNPDRPTMNNRLAAFTPELSAIRDKILLEWALVDCFAVGAAKHGRQIAITQ
jgi:hypothetical protein